MASAVVTETNNDGQEVSAYSNLIQACHNCGPELSKKAREGAEAFVKIFDSVKNVLGTKQKLSDFIESIIKASGLDEYHKASDEIEGTQRVQNLEELVNSAVPYECTLDGLISFLDAINLDRTLEIQEGESPDDAVTLITLHNTKGLEYKRVLITGLEDGVFPRNDKTAVEMEEERRLFYVGITRARDELYITSVASRFMYGHIEFLGPSQFLKEAATAFNAIGQIPLGFKKALWEKRESNLSESGVKIITMDSFASSSSSDDIPFEDQELMKKYKKGKKVYHDDYGYGVIYDVRYKNGEVVVDIVFENGGKKKFLPRNQPKAIEIIKN